MRWGNDFAKHLVWDPIASPDLREAGEAAGEKATRYIQVIPGCVALRYRLVRDMVNRLVIGGLIAPAAAE